MTPQLLIPTPGRVDQIGGTPLLPVSGLEGVPDTVQVWGKAEWLNPGGSVKDRAAWAMVRDGLERGLLAGGRRLLDATSGNTGISYTWIGGVLGLKVVLCVPANL